MLKVEKIEGIYDVTLRGEPEEQAKEWAVLTSGLLCNVPLSTLENLLKVAAKKSKEMQTINNQQSTQFSNRLAHLIETKGWSLAEVFVATGISKEDQEDVKDGILPSTDGLRRIAKLLDVKPEYFWEQTKSETD